MIKASTILSKQYMIIGIADAGGSIVWGYTTMHSSNLKLYCPRSGYSGTSLTVLMSVFKVSTSALEPHVVTGVLLFSTLPKRFVTQNFSY